MSASEEEPGEPGIKDMMKLLMTINQRLESVEEKQNQQQVMGPDPGSATAIEDDANNEEEANKKKKKRNKKKKKKTTTTTKEKEKEEESGDEESDSSDDDDDETVEYDSVLIEPKGPIPTIPISGTDWTSTQKQVESAMDDYNAKGIITGEWMEPRKNTKKEIRIYKKLVLYATAVLREGVNKGDIKAKLALTSLPANSHPSKKWEKICELYKPHEQAIVSRLLIRAASGNVGQHNGDGLAFTQDQETTYIRLEEKGHKVPDGQAKAQYMKGLMTNAPPGIVRMLSGYAANRMIEGDEGKTVYDCMRDVKRILSAQREEESDAGGASGGSTTAFMATTSEPTVPRCNRCNLFHETSTRCPTQHARPFRGRGGGRGRGRGGGGRHGGRGGGSGGGRGRGGNKPGGGRGQHQRGCYRCGDEGHKVFQCPEDYAERKAKPQANTVEIGAGGVAYGKNVAYFTGNGPVESWPNRIIDSGASATMHNRADEFTETQKAAGQVDTAGEDSLEVTGVGTVGDKKNVLCVPQLRTPIESVSQ